MTLQAGSTFSGTGTLHMNGVTTVTGPLTLTVPTQLTGDGDRVGVAADGGADDVDVRDDLAERRADGGTGARR